MNNRRFSILSIILLFPLAGHGQPVFGTYRQSRTFCARTIALWEDSTFFSEYGCEGTSHISFGRYTIHGETISFSPVQKDSVDLFFAIDWLDSLTVNGKKIPDDPACTVVMTRNMVPIHNLNLVFYDDRETPDEEQTNECGFRYLFGESEVYIPVLSKIFKRFVSHPIPPNPDQKRILLIRLNIPVYYLNYPTVGYSDEAFELFLNQEEQGLSYQKNGEASLIRSDQ